MIHFNIIPPKNPKLSLLLWSLDQNIACIEIYPMRAACPTAFVLDLNILEVKVKGKGVPLHAMKAFRGRGGTAPSHSHPRH
jgi:hypothetical protein